MNNFVESDHPRDNAGKFTSGGTGEPKMEKDNDIMAGKGENEQMGIRVYNPTITKKITGEEWAEIEEYSKLLGEEFKGFKGQDAIDKLITEKRGHIKGAFHRDEIGEIDLIWGDNKFGVQHIIKQREKQGVNANEFLGNISDIINKGKVIQNSIRHNFEISYNHKTAVISPTLRGNEINYLLTAFMNYETKSTP
jgi:hypothetical protein